MVYNKHQMENKKKASALKLIITESLILWEFILFIYLFIRIGSTNIRKKTQTKTRS